jgi:hypothetical protein
MAGIPRLFLLSRVGIRRLRAWVIAGLLLGASVATARRRLRLGAGVTQGAIRMSAVP